MAYCDFSLQAIVDQAQLQEEETVLFPEVMPHAPSAWLRETLDRGQELALLSSSEKSRSEFIIAPILLEIETDFRDRLTLHSGRNLEGDRSLGLNGECDFIFSRGQRSRTIQAPILAVVEAKRQDIDAGLGQCAAQLVGAIAYNQRRNQSPTTLYGCTTTGEVWYFLSLKSGLLRLDRRPRYLNELELILGIFYQIAQESLAQFS